MELLCLLFSPLPTHHWEHWVKQGSGNASNSTGYSAPATTPWNYTRENSTPCIPLHWCRKSTNALMMMRWGELGFNFLLSKHVSFRQQWTTERLRHPTGLFPPPCPVPLVAARFLMLLTLLLDYFGVMSLALIDCPSAKEQGSACNALT